MSEQVIINSGFISEDKSKKLSVTIGRFNSKEEFYEKINKFIEKKSSNDFQNLAFNSAKNLGVSELFSFLNSKMKYDSGEGMRGFINQMLYDQNFSFGALPQQQLTQLKSELNILKDHYFKTPQGHQRKEMYRDFKNMFDYININDKKPTFLAEKIKNRLHTKNSECDSIFDFFDNKVKELTEIAEDTSGKFPVEMRVKAKEELKSGSFKTLKMFSINSTRNMLEALSFRDIFKDILLNKSFYSDIELHKNIVLKEELYKSIEKNDVSFTNNIKNEKRVVNILQGIDFILKNKKIKMNPEFLKEGEVDVFSQIRSFVDSLKQDIIRTNSHMQLTEALGYNLNKDESKNYKMLLSKKEDVREDVKKYEQTIQLNERLVKSVKSGLKEEQKAKIEERVRELKRDVKKLNKEYDLTNSQNELLDFVAKTIYRYDKFHKYIDKNGKKAELIDFICSIKNINSPEFVNAEIGSSILKFYADKNLHFLKETLRNKIPDLNISKVNPQMIENQKPYIKEISEDLKKNVKNFYNFAMLYNEGERVEKIDIEKELISLKESVLNWIDKSKDKNQEKRSLKWNLEFEINILIGKTKGIIQKKEEQRIQETIVLQDLYF